MLAAYASTKYALNALSLTARQELAKDNIIVSVFHPKMTATDFGKNARGQKYDSHAGRPGMSVDTPEAVAERIADQILHPEALPDEHIRELNKIGMNHICFRVDDIEAEVAKIRAAGFKTRNEIMDFHSRKLVFLDGPEGVTVELSQWY
jgi:NAD(P)-dependent dehydrogenase (short-subunit alcohol dehydrogenase family)